MQINRIKNTKRNAVWGMVEKVISLALPFVLRTIIIKELGESVLGLNSLFTSLLQVLNMAELGFSNAIIYNMYKPVAENDTDIICALMNLYRKVYYVIGVIVLLIGLVLVPFLPQLIKGTVPEGYNLYVLYAINLFNTVISYFLFAYKNCLLNAYHRNDIISKVRTLTLFFQYAYQFFVLLVFKDYYLYLIILPIITIANNIINAYIVTKLFPEYKCRGKLSKSKIEDIKLNVSGLMIGKICLVSRNSFDSIFVSAFLGLTSVAMYTNYYYIISAVNIFLSVITESMRAGIGNSIVTETVEKNYHDFRVFYMGYAWLSGWCTICLLCLFQPFMKLWMGESLMFPYTTVVLFAVYFYSLKLGDIRSVYSNSTGLFWQSRHYVIIEAISNVVLNYVFVKIWGVNGIIVATNLTIIFINFVWGTIVIFKYYFVNESFIRFVGEQFSYFLVNAMVAGVTIYICKMVVIGDIIGFIIKIAICITVPNLLFLLVYSRFPLFKDAYVFTKRIIKR